MSSEPSIEVPSVPRNLGLKPSFLFLLAGALCLLVASLVHSPAISQGLQIAAAGLLLIAAIRRMISMFRKRNRDQVISATAPIIADDRDIALITDSDLMVRESNAATRIRLGQVNGQSVAAVFGHIVADPSLVLQDVRIALHEGRAYKDNVVTHAATYRLSVVPIGRGYHLWRLDDLSAVAAPQPQAAQSTLPWLTIDAAGHIINLNDAARRLCGHRPKELGEIVADLPVRSGHIHIVLTDTGEEPRTLIAVPSSDDRTDLYLLPEVAAVAPPRLNPGWDTIEELPVPLLKVGRTGAILASNREARTLLNVDDTKDRHLADLLDGLGRPINDWLREAVEGRGAHESQFLRGRNDNQDTFVQVTLNLSGELADSHLIAVLNDVTELKTLEGQFVQSQKMQAIGQLAGGVAHDFNNLLTAISGHCDLLLLRHNEGDQNYGDLIQIHQNANRAASLVGQLLAFSRKQNLQPEVLDLRDTLSDLTHLLNRLVGEKVVLSLNHDPALAQIKADKRQLEQVLMNLVVNARDAMPKGGKIQVVTQNLALQKSMVRDRAIVPPGNYVMVQVSDEGHGVPPDRLPKIFEPFYTTKRPGEGTGLGLSTAYGIVKQTGGYIFAESEVGEGTQFTLLFPSYDLPVAAPIHTSPMPTERLMSDADAVVLLVEDEAPVRAFASRALRLRGYSVLEADCAEAALDMLKDDELMVDLFVTDVIMPGMDGPTWVRKAREDRPDTAVVFVSGYAEDAFGDENSRINNSVFLPKPFSLNALTQTVQSQLQNQRQNRASATRSGVSDQPHQVGG